jgi:hypothetical protein
VALGLGRYCKKSRILPKLDRLQLLVAVGPRTKEVVDEDNLLLRDVIATAKVYRQTPGMHFYPHFARCSWEDTRLRRRVGWRRMEAGCSLPHKLCPRRQDLLRTMAD